MTQIAALKASDFDAWHPLWHGYLTFYEAAVAEEATRLSFERMLDPAEPMFGALAWREGRAVGLVHWILHRSTWTSGDYCYLQDLFVDPQTRGGGLGRGLIEHVYADAARRKCSRVYWLTHETNRNAMLLYDRIASRSGFVQYRKMLG